MERQFNRTRYHQNQNGNIMPIILYLTLPTVNLHHNTSMANNRKVKHQKQKQRDFKRMKQFNQQKTICSVFPFYSLENNEIQNMVTRPAPVQYSQTNSKLDKVKICNILQENEKLKSLNMELKDNLKTLNGNLVRVNSEFEHKLTKKTERDQKVEY